jgi:hypothetical protein
MATKLTVLRLGNTAPVYSVAVGDGTNAAARMSRADLGNQVTDFEFPAGAAQEEASALSKQTGNDRIVARLARALPDKDERYLLALVDIEITWWGAHSDDPPEWVESNDQEFARVVCEYFNREGAQCVVGRPDGWASGADDGLEALEDKVTRAEVFHEARAALNAKLEKRDLPPIGGGMSGTSYLPEEFSEDFITRWREHELLTSVGRDALHAQNLGTAAQPAAFNYMAFTANNGAPASGDTALTGEIATASGGLIRGQATYAHTTGTNTSTLTRVVTANGNDSLPVTIAKDGVFNASSSGTLGYTALLNATATLSAIGDNLTNVKTVTAG